jgi:hypothetical protein
MFIRISLITYQETYLLVDDHLSTQDTRQEVALIVAHELAHQWFGNLVVSDIDTRFTYPIVINSIVIDIQDNGMVERSLAQRR